MGQIIYFGANFRCEYLMSDLVHYEYPPPRSWEQFEELCADLFEALWSDPRVVRHGRAGQTQFGVDIIASRGGIYPVGLQCKKKSRWPPKSLTMKEINREIKEAEKFKPALKEFYILTTAPTDTPLQEQVRTLSEARRNAKKFEVEVLFWPEIVRRVARFEAVASKHFPIRGGQEKFSPLLATWYTKAGELELEGKAWHLAVAELGLDFHWSPTGRVVVRQRETDALVEELNRLSESKPSDTNRDDKLRVRRELRYAQERERRIQNLLRMLYTNEYLKFYMLDLDETGADAREIVRSLVECVMGRERPMSDLKIRLAPPASHLLSGPRSRYSVADDDLAVFMPEAEYRSIRQAEQNFRDRHEGRAMIRVVSELPHLVRTQYAIPAIVLRIERIMDEERKSLEEMQFAGYLDLNGWTFTL